MVARSGQVISWDDLLGEASNADEVRKARRLQADYFKQLGVYNKVPAQQAKDGGHRIASVRRMDVKKPKGTHKSGLLAKTD